MADEPEVIRQQMEETRSALTEKLETLEQQVVDTVQGATSAVTETVEKVKGSVQDTVETVKETFNVRRQVEHHPWLMFGGSVALGYLGGRLLDRSEPSRAGFHGSALYGNGWGGKRHGDEMQEVIRAAPAPESSRPAEESWISSLAQRFEPEIDRLKGLAVGAVLSLVRDMVASSAPSQLRPQLTEVMNNITTKMGGQPLAGSLWQESKSGRAAGADESPEERFDSPYAADRGWT
jgi:hypothetical protein